MKKNNILLIIATTLILSSCGSSRSAQYESSDLSNTVTEEVLEYNDVNNKLTNVFTSDISNYDNEEKRETKLILEGNIESTTNTFDTTLNNVKQTIESYDAFFEQSTFTNNNYKYFNSTIKVPISNYNNLYNDLKNFGINIYSSSNAINTTNGYYSLKSKIEVKKVYVERLESLIDVAVEPEELLSLYNNYFSARSELQTMEATLQNLDYVTSYSTIYFSLEEEKTKQIVTVPKEGFLKEIAIGFNTSISMVLSFVQLFLLTLAYISVPTILITVILIISLIIYKKKNL